MQRSHVIFKPDGLGDLILALGAIRLLAERFGENQLVLVVNTQCETFAAEQFPTAAIVGIHFTSGLLRDDLLGLLRSLSALWRFRRRKVVCLRHQRGRLMQLALAALRPTALFFSENLLTNSPVPHFPRMERWFLSLPGAHVAYPSVATTDQCLELEANRQVLAAAIGENVSPRSVQPEIHGCLTREDFHLMVTPFGSATVKNYPHLVPALERFLDQTASDFDVKIACTSSQKTDALALLSEITPRYRSRFHLITPLTVFDFVKTVASARAVLTVDTGTAHIATALDKSVVILIGGGNFGSYGPWCRSSRQRWIYRKMPCFNCFWNCQFETIRCLVDISPQAVADELTTAWNLANLENAERHQA